MSKKLYLSNSQINTYLDCPRKWYYDKVEKIRPNYLGSALYFGTLIDDTIEAYLLKQDYKAVYQQRLNNFEVNGKAKTIEKNILDIRFGAGDVDDKLVEQHDIDNYCDNNELQSIELREFLDYCKAKRKRRSALNKQEQEIFNFIAFKSLEEKSRLLIDELIKWIDENVVEVHSTQKKIDIVNGCGDRFIGYLDFVVTLKNGKKVLVDLKTSSDPNKYYPTDSASKSRQLGIYSQEEKLPDVAYLVGDKKIRVREPRVRLKFVEGVITEEWLDDVFDEIERVTEAIKDRLPDGKQAFEKNLDSCNNFGGCPYRGLCEKNSMKGLEKVK